MTLRPGRWILHSPVAILPFLAALVLEGPALQADISRRVSENIAASGMSDWAKTSVQGRDVTLSGDAPSAEAVTGAIAAAASAVGVRKVTSLLRVAPQPAIQP